MNTNVINYNKQEEYNKFKKLCPNAREIIYEDGSKSLVVEKEGKEQFRLYLFKDFHSECSLPFSISVDKIYLC